MAATKEDQKSKVKSKKRQSSIVNSKSKIARAWRITDFQELFELPDDIRKKRSGPLTYIKNLINLSAFASDAEVAFFERMKILKSRPNRHLLRSVFDDLLAWTGDKHFGPRGWFVDGKNRPADYKYIACQLDGISVSELKAAFRDLASIGLIERDILTFRNEPDDSGALCAEESKGKYKKKKKKPTRGMDKAQRAAKGQGAGPGKEPGTMPIADKPTSSDAEGQGERVIPFARPRGRLANTARLDDAVRKALFKLDPIAREFAPQVYAALGYRWPLEHSNARREIESFASVIHDCTLGLSPPEAAEICRRAVADAAKRKKYWKNPAAGWIDYFRKLSSSKAADYG